MLGAGLVARNAVARVASTVSSRGSRQPGAGLQGRDQSTWPRHRAHAVPRGARLLHLVGYGCTTCIGNSGPLPEADRGRAIQGQRPGGRLGALGQPQLRGPHHARRASANYLASPPLVRRLCAGGHGRHRPVKTEPLGDRPRRQPGVPQGHLAKRRTRSNDTVMGASEPGDVRARKQYGERLRGNDEARGMRSSPVKGDTLRLERRLDLYPGAAVLRRICPPTPHRRSQPISGGP